MAYSNNATENNKKSDAVAVSSLSSSGTVQPQKKRQRRDIPWVSLAHQRQLEAQANGTDVVEASPKKIDKNYISRLKNDELGLSYSPDDKLILDKATVSVFGDYVIYVITPAEDSTTIITRTENLLTAE